MSLATRTLALAGFFLAPGAAAQTAAPLALTGGTVYPAPDQPAIRDAVVLLREAASPPSARGLGERPSRHRHPRLHRPHRHRRLLEQPRALRRAEVGARRELPAAEASEQLRQMLTGYGFTHVFDTGSPLENTLALRRRIAAGEIEGPAILTTGDIIWPKGGVPSLAVMTALGFITEPQDEVATPAEAAARARERLDGGADGVKVYAATWFGGAGGHARTRDRRRSEADPRPGQAPLRSPDERRRPGSGARRRSRRDGAHRARHGDLERLAGAGMVKAGVAVVPTLKLWRYETRRRGWRSPARSSRQGSTSSARSTAQAGRCCSVPTSATCWTTTRRRNSR